MKLYFISPPKKVTSIQKIDIEHDNNGYRAKIICQDDLIVFGKYFDNLEKLISIIKLFLLNHNGIDKFGNAQQSLEKLFD